ncbi:Tetratricopeptide repeat-containing protein [Allochromatium warmingii]|uniref:Tetratricopeptide repeat-containing protein n=1 Tax=Allochromatium warmingii TaxID=61595 RepID=A0A1H3DWE2_ALLWA|nr:tetratricopeptide repeat-containing response regulator [Allochromatium warmingii]SDX70004.1 Tetratricopeptide repeat-containing protein [Allochromatium warmingii]
MTNPLFAPKSFLVVDDMGEMRSAIKAMLVALGSTQVEQARDGLDAIQKMKQKRFDVILCDYNLGPGKDGQQVLEEARLRHLIGVDVIFVMITAENARGMVMGAVEYAPDSYVSKPFTKELLEARLLKLFERKADLAAVNKALVAKDKPGALREINALIANKPRNLGELLKIKSEICIDTNLLDEAEATLKQVLAVREMPWAVFSLGKIAFLRKQFDQAETIFKQLIAQDPTFISAYDWLAKSQTAQRQFDAAENTLREAIRISPRNIPRQHTLADLALNNGHSDVAEHAYTQAVGLAKHSVLNHPAIFAGLAKSKSVNGKHDEALKVTRDIRKSFPDQPEATFYAASANALVKANQGDHEGAAAALALAEQALAGLNETAHASDYALELAKTYVELGQGDKAAPILQQAIANNHDDEAILAQIITLCQESDLKYDAETEIRTIQQALIKTNNEGVHLIKQGQFDAAIKLLSQAAEQMPGNKTINLNAAMAMLMYMEHRGINREDVQTVHHYVERIQRLAPDDWRLADLNKRLRKLLTGLKSDG